MNSLLSLLAMLKGAPLSILWALLLSPAPLSRLELRMVTGYQKDTLNEGLARLTALGLVVESVERFSGTERLAGLIGQLQPLLSAESTSPPDQIIETVEEAETSAPDESVGPGLPAEQAPEAKKSLLEALIINKDLLRGFEQLRGVETAAEAKKSPQGEAAGDRLGQTAGQMAANKSSAGRDRASPPGETPPNLPPVGDDIGDDIREAFAQAGIVLNKRTEALASRAHITADYVRAHHRQLQANGRGDWTGLLITILESGAPAPPTAATHDRMRYITGEFAEFIEHE